MAKEPLPDALWAWIAPLLPPEPKGGRPQVSDQAALTGILFVLKTGIPRIARCGVEPKNRLGRYRWVVERMPPGSTTSGA